MVANQSRITARVDEDTKRLLLNASKISGSPSINAFIVSSAVDRAKKILEQERVFELSNQDSELLLKALEDDSSSSRLNKAFKTYANI